MGIRMSDDLRKRLKRWSAAQKDKPTASEATRRLLVLALTATGF